MDTTPAWVVPAMRIGFFGRGLTYAVTGGLAVSAALYGGTVVLRKKLVDSETPAALIFYTTLLCCWAVWPPRSLCRRR